MKIQASQIALSSERTASSVYRMEESLRAARWGAGGESDLELHRRVEYSSTEADTYQQLSRSRSTGAAPLLAPTPWRLELAPLPASPRNAFAITTAPQFAPSPQIATSTAESNAVPADSEIMLLKLLIEWLSGREVQVAHIAAPSPETATNAAGASTGGTPPPAQFSIDYSFSEYYQEAESTSFHATGTIETVDGKQIAFDLSLLMQRSFESSTTMAFHAGNRKDPLLINLAGGGAELSSARYRFDVDGDGSTEEIAFATGNSAFIAIDLDSNGRISGGSELLGALSGDGFAELARHDADGSGFIDEADPVFARLLAYRKDAAGADQLASLASLGVGALYLGSAATSFDLRTADNAALGTVRKTGMFLGEDGSVGTLQQVDLVV